jgi:hypothetical protein
MSDLNVLVGKASKQSVKRALEFSAERDLKQDQDYQKLHELTEKKNSKREEEQLARQAGHQKGEQQAKKEQKALAKEIKDFRRGVRKELKETKQQIREVSDEKLKPDLEAKRDALKAKVAWLKHPDSKKRYITYQKYQLEAGGAEVQETLASEMGQGARSAAAELALRSKDLDEKTQVLEGEPAIRLKGDMASYVSAVMSGDEENQGRVLKNFHESVEILRKERGGVTVDNLDEMPKIIESLVKQGVAEEELQQYIRSNMKVRTSDEINVGVNMEYVAKKESWTGKMVEAGTLIGVGGLASKLGMAATTAKTSATSMVVRQGINTVVGGALVGGAASAVVGGVLGIGKGAKRAKTILAEQEEKLARGEQIEEQAPIAVFGNKEMSRKERILGVFGRANKKFERAVTEKFLDKNIQPRQDINQMMADLDMVAKLNHAGGKLDLLARAEARLDYLTGGKKNGDVFHYSDESSVDEQRLQLMRQVDELKAGLTEEQQTQLTERTQAEMAMLVAERDARHRNERKFKVAMIAYNVAKGAAKGAVLGSIAGAVVHTPVAQGLGRWFAETPVGAFLAGTKPSGGGGAAAENLQEGMELRGSVDYDDLPKIKTHIGEGGGFGVDLDGDGIPDADSLMLRGNGSSSLSQDSIELLREQGFDIVERPTGTGNVMRNYLNMDDYLSKHAGALKGSGAMDQLGGGTRVWDASGGVGVNSITESANGDIVVHMGAGSMNPEDINVALSPSGGSAPDQWFKYEVNANGDIVVPKGDVAHNLFSEGAGGKIEYHGNRIEAYADMAEGDSNMRVLSTFMGENDAAGPIAVAEQGEIPGDYVLRNVLTGEQVRLDTNAVLAEMQASSPNTTELPVFREREISFAESGAPQAESGYVAAHNEYYSTEKLAPTNWNPPLDGKMDRSLVPDEVWAHGEGSAQMKVYEAVYNQMSSPEQAMMYSNAGDFGVFRDNFNWETVSPEARDLLRPYFADGAVTTGEMNEIANILGKPENASIFKEVTNLGTRDMYEAALKGGGSIEEVHLKPGYASGAENLDSRTGDLHVFSQQNVRVDGGNMLVMKDASGHNILDTPEARRFLGIPDNATNVKVGIQERCGNLSADYDMPGGGTHTSTGTEGTGTENENTGTETEDTGTEDEDTGTETEDTGTEDESTGTETEDTGTEDENTGVELDKKDEGTRPDYHDDGGPGDQTNSNDGTSDTSIEDVTGSSKGGEDTTVNPDEGKNELQPERPV